MIITINTIHILRAEVQMYQGVLEAATELISKKIEEYESRSAKIESIHDKLYNKVRNANYGIDYSGMITVELDYKYLSLIEEQLILENDLRRKYLNGFDIVNEFNHDYLKELDYWCTRIETVEYYLIMLDKIILSLLHIRAIYIGKVSIYLIDWYERGVFVNDGCTN